MEIKRILKRSDEAAGAWRIFKNKKAIEDLGNLSGLLLAM